MSLAQRGGVMSLPSRERLVDWLVQRIARDAGVPAAQVPLHANVAAAMPHSAARQNLRTNIAFSLVRHVRRATVASGYRDCRREDHVQRSKIHFRVRLV